MLGCNRVANVRPICFLCYMREEESILAGHGVKITANRILILRALMDAHAPLSMTELETRLETIDKSIISRTLAAFKEHHLVHHILSGDESRYELCHVHGDHGNNDDEHVHFFCEKCRRTFCLEELEIPAVAFPEGFEVSEINFVATGICPDCRKKA